MTTVADGIKELHHILLESRQDAEDGHKRLRSELDRLNAVIANIEALQLVQTAQLAKPVEVTQLRFPLPVIQVQQRPPG